ncbi:flagellar biosynthesis anti-sigma factor FlgM [Novosphingobium sp. TH158]|uniref:flagellar biosynthesis anti-sigma factor FlgM n=1 Tax=Novosphingobium sp. TH158 TaxID=2067455 RepID=UPI000C7E7926|nr:flagellar biosynthesis anti-sigma factor FlgM [Novosphingobium sp. TH158]PLK27656.1 flagellar biosynthesis anti-sigma factor FlgM [Novosphingobium sp. TH158]
MPIEPSQSVGPLRTVSALDARTVRTGAGERPADTGRAAPQTMVATSEALDPGPVPVDTERVSQVRKAIESGSYPLVPAKIADAIIAAGLLLRSPK